MRVGIVLGLVAAALMAVGCGKGDNTCLITGKVSLNGTPLESGQISFKPSDGKGATAGAVITNGSYTAKVPRGRKSVQITGVRRVGERPAYEGLPDSPKVPEVKSIGETTVDYEVTGPATKDFEIKSP